MEQGEVRRKGGRRRSPGQSEGEDLGSASHSLGGDMQKRLWLLASRREQMTGPGAPREVAGPLAATPGVETVNNVRSEAEGKCRVTVPQPVCEEEARGNPAPLLIGEDWKS